MSNPNWTRDDLHRIGWKPSDGKGGVVSVKSAPEMPALPKPQIRIPRRRVMNKLEARWFESAKLRWPTFDIRYECVSFVLPSGSRYLADFTGWDKNTLVWVAETKGAFIHNSRSVLAWKEAAAAWTHVMFLFCQRRNGEWAETQINQTPNDGAKASGA